VTLEPVALGPLTDGVVDDVAAQVTEKGHRLTVEGADQIPAMMADAQLRRQVVLNLTADGPWRRRPPGRLHALGAYHGEPVK
jgi:hypothetical protein